MFLVFSRFFYTFVCSVFKGLKTEEIKNTIFIISLNETYINTGHVARKHITDVQYMIGLKRHRLH